MAATNLKIRVDTDFYLRYKSLLSAILIRKYRSDAVIDKIFRTLFIIRWAVSSIGRARDS